MISDTLTRISRGEVLYDEWSREVYSVDASHYLIKPAVVACPRDFADVQAICNYSSSKKVSVTARGAGTGLLGQSLSDGGIVLDFAKNMNRIIELGENYVLVEPGIVKGYLDKELKKRHKFLPPDPASSNYCTIGGMIANNSSGAHSLGYGSTIDFIEALDLVYSDGSVGRASSNKIDEGGAKKDRRLELVSQILDENASLINDKFPKVSKNSSGYRLDAAIKTGGFEPQKLIAASEGTLAVVTSAKLRILDLPQYRLLVVLGFEDIISAMQSVPIILQSSPAALEMLDSTILAPTKSGKEEGCLLYVEFAGDNKTKLEDQMSKCKDQVTRRMSSKGTVVKVMDSAMDEESLNRIWAARKAALGNTMKLTVGSRRPIGLIEDTVVNAAILDTYTEYLIQTYRTYKLDYVMYGHVGNGNIHTRPLIDPDCPSELEMINALAEQVFSRVIASGGTISGEHGDGIARLAYIGKMYGKKTNQLFQAVKEIFDPQYLLNPGKKVPFKSRANVI